MKTFNIEQCRTRSSHRGISIKGSDGKELYDFYAPVVSITGAAGESSSLDLSVVGETSAQKERRVIGVVRMAVLPTTLDEAVAQLQNCIFL